MFTNLEGDTICVLAQPEYEKRLAWITIQPIMTADIPKWGNL